MFSLLIKMAWKNLFLRSARTFLVIVMIAVSMGMMLAIEGLYDGMSINMIDKNKRSASGDISIFTQNYRVQRDIKYTIKDALDIKQNILKMDGVKAVVLRLRADGLSSTARKSSFASLIGINLADEERFGKFSDFLKDGKLEFEKRGAFVGIELAKRLKVSIGSKLIFSTQDSAGEINSISLKVKAIIQTTNIELDNSAIYVDTNRLHKFLGLPMDEVTQISIMGSDKGLYSKLKESYPNLSVDSFLELQPMMKQMQDMMDIFNSITFFIVMSVVFIGIFGVMYVSILDRIREFGIMLSIGMSYKYIRTQIILEAFFVGVLGYLSGALIGIAFLIYLKYYGLDMSAFSDALAMWGYESVIYGTIKLSYFSNTFLAIMSASLLSVIIPLRKIKRLNPIEVIKAEK